VAQAELAEPFQDFDAIVARQIEIENDQVQRFDARELARQDLQHFLAVGSHLEFTSDFVFAESLADEVHVRRVVLGEEYFGHRVFLRRFFF
jgi:hypothetical protein